MKDQDYATMMVYFMSAIALFALAIILLVDPGYMQYLAAIVVAVIIVLFALSQLIFIATSCSSTITFSLLCRLFILNNQFVNLTLQSLDLSLAFFDREAT